MSSPEIRISWGLQWLAAELVTNWRPWTWMQFCDGLVDWGDGKMLVWYFLLVFFSFFFFPSGNKCKWISALEKKKKKIRVKGFWLFCTRATDLLLPEQLISALERMKKKIRTMGIWGFCTIATNLLVPQREREKECSKKLKLFFFTLWDACTAVWLDEREGKIISSNIHKLLLRVGKGRPSRESSVHLQWVASFGSCALQCVCVQFYPEHTCLQWQSW